MRKDKDLVALGREILRLRRARGLKLPELEKLSGLHRNYIGGIERADRNVGMASIFKLARALDLHPAELMGTIP